MPEAVLLKSDTDGAFNILKSDELVIGGYASIEVVDKQNDLITLSALEESVKKYMGEKKYRNVMSNHSNVQVGEVIEQYRDKHGTLHKTHVDDVGFYVVIKLRDDIEKAKEISRGIRKGTLRSFSIGGQALSKRKKSSNELGDYNEIDKLELHEVTICEKGINPEAKFDILKEERDTMSDKLEKTLEEINALMKQVNELQKEEDPDAEAAKASSMGSYESMDTDEEKEAGDYKKPKDEEMAMADMGSDDDESEVSMSNYDSEAKGRTGPEGFVEGGLAGEESAGKKLPQAPQVGPLYKEWQNDEFATLDLSTANVEKAYDATEVRKADVLKNEYDAKNEVEALRAEFATLRKSLETTNDEIVKSQTVEVPDIDVSEMSWGEIHNLVAEYER
jgi:HK97 family phage prohead protease